MSLHALTAVVVPVTQTAFLLGDATAIQSFLNEAAVLTKSFTITVASASAILCGAIKKSTSMLSLSSNLSKPLKMSSLPNVVEVTPPVNDHSF